jgi:hypothetical protein
MSESKTQCIEVKEGERAGVCVRSGGNNFTLVVHGPGSLDVMLSNSEKEYPCRQRERLEETCVEVSGPRPASLVFP